VGKTIAVCNQKGGVGKTTTTINLSSYLAVANKKILIIDIDPQANASSGVGADKKNISKTIYNVLINQISLKDAVISTCLSNMSLVPADLHLTGAQIELVSLFGREQRLKSSIKEIKDLFDFIFIDCPPNLGLLTINALTAADTVLIPLQCEYYAMEGLGQLLHTIKLVQENLNASLGVEGVILTMADFRTNLTNEVINEAKEFFKEKVYNSIIPRSVKLSEAPGYGKPILLYDKESQGGQAYRLLSEEFLSRNNMRTLELQNNNEKTLERIGTQSDEGSASL